MRVETGRTADGGRRTAEHRRSTQPTRWAFFFFAVGALLQTRVAAATCGGDCDSDGMVTVDEIVGAVGAKLMNALPAQCPAADVGQNGVIDDSDLQVAVENALAGCADQQAFVVATDFETGSFATVALGEPPQVQKANPQRSVNSDAVARTHGGLVYVINRVLGDNIQAIDPASNFSTIWQCSVGAGSNPHDIAFVNATKAYVSRYGAAQLWIVNPSAPPDCTNFKSGEIDLSSLADVDGIPEMDQMAVVGNRLYVVLDYLDRNAFFAPAGQGRIAVIDIDADQVVGVILLTGENPFWQQKGIPVRDGKLIVSETGLYGVNDGGIEMVDPVSQQAQGFFITESDLGGDITDFVLVSDQLGYAILSLADFTNSVVAFDPSQRKVTATLLSGSSFVSNIELDTRGELYTADRTAGAPGLRVFRAADGSALTGLLDTGLPPFDIVFLK